MYVTIYPHKAGTTPVRSRTGPIAWHDLVTLLSTHERRAAKDGPLFSLAELRRDGTRQDVDVERVHGLVIDVDKVNDVECDAVLAATAHLTRIVYSTWSHPEKQAEGLFCLRIVVPYSRPVSPDQHRAVWDRAMARFGVRVGKGGGVDQCRAPSWAFYLPAAPFEADALHVVSEAGEGIALDVDDVLRDPAPPGAPAAERKRGPSAIPAHVVFTDEHRKMARSDLEDACALVRAQPFPGPVYPTLNGYSFKIGRYVPHLLERDHAVAELLRAAHARNPDEAFREGRQSYEQIVTRAVDDGAEQPWFPGSAYSLTESGNAERFADMTRERLRFVSSWGKWIAYDGKRWRIEGADEIALAATKHVIAELWRDVNECRDEDYQKLLRAHAKKSESAAARSAMLRLATAEDGVAIDHNALDADPYLLNVANGTLDLRSGKLRQHSPGDLITKLAPVSYNESAPAPRWESFVVEIMNGDEERAAYLQRAVGYALTGDVREHALFFLYGCGANGKSTFVNAILAMLGSYAAPGAPNLLIAKKGGEAHPTEQADLAGLRFVACSEVEEGRAWNEVGVKALTGGEPIKARRMREDFWHFTPSHKFFVSGNHKPMLRSTDDGIRRRLHLLGFEVSFRDRPDRKLESKLRAELPGILAWAVRGCLSWQRHGLNAPKSVIEATREYVDSQDVFGSFARDHLVFAPDAEVPRSAIEQRYTQWCVENGEERFRMGGKGLALKLADRGVVDGGKRYVGGRHVRFWRGVRLASEADFAPSRLRVVEGGREAAE